MKTFLDSHSVQLACPACGHKFSETVGKLRTNPDIQCVCGKNIAINADQLDAAAKSVDQEIANLKRALSQLGKR